ncbi:MAG: ABC transporter permease [Flavobacteriaceae bacterium]
MQIRLEPRAEPWKAMQYMSPVIALLLTAFTGLLLLNAVGRDPWAALYTFTISPIRDLYGVGELLLRAAPLILIGIGLSVGFRANVWNIGAEGQLTVGAIFSGGLALQFADSDSALLLPAMIVAAAIGGMAWAAIPAFLRTRFNANEILVSLMLSYVAQLWLSYLIYGPWRDPQGFNFPQSEPLTAAALYPVLIEGTRLNASILITVVAIVVGWIFLNRSFIGFQLKVTGLAAPAARYAGFNANRAIWIGMLAGGLAGGLAGVGEVAGPLGQLYPTASPGYGFAAIIVAFLGRLNPIGITLAGLLMSLLYLSGEAAQLELNLPPATTGLFQGVLLFFLLGADFFIYNRVRLVRRVAALEGVTR